MDLTILVEIAVVILIAVVSWLWREISKNRKAIDSLESDVNDKIDKIDSEINNRLTDMDSNISTVRKHLASIQTDLEWVKKFLNGDDE